MGGFKRMLEGFFSEEENYLPGAGPEEADGITFVPYQASLDAEAVWPNASCGACGRLTLKKGMYFDPRAGTFLHPSCLRRPGAEEPGPGKETGDPSGSSD